MTGAARSSITGLGALTPLGPDVAALIEGLLAMRSGVRLLDEPEFAELPARLAATVDLTGRLDRVEARTLDRVQQLALVAAREAWADAGAPEVAPERLAVVVGSGIGGALTILGQHDVLREKGPRRVSPHLVPMLMPNGPAAAVGLDLGARAGVHTPVSACASGAEALAQAMDMLRSGRADVVVAGGSEACVHPLPMAGFAQMRALSTRHDDPAAASRPYDKARDGFVLGEGAGILVLELEEHARARGARVHARLAGCGHGLRRLPRHRPRPERQRRGAQHPDGAARRRAGARGHRPHQRPRHLDPARRPRRGPGLRQGAWAAHRPAVTATKSCTGHLLGAAGAVEAIAAVVALRDSLVAADPQPRRPRRRGRRRRRARSSRAQLDALGGAVDVVRLRRPRRRRWS